MVNKYFKYRPSVCKRCNKEYRRTSGKQLYCSRECNRQDYWEFVVSDEYKNRVRQQVNPKKQRRRHWIEKYKVAKGCEICGYNKAACALDFDHINPKK